MPGRTIALSASAAVLIAIFVVTRPSTSHPAAPKAETPAVESVARRSPSDTVDYLIAARSKGSPDAPITVLEMSDFQCPFCRQHAVGTFPELDRRYIQTGKVRWIFINFPIPQLHPNAAAAAEFAMCAAREGKFWPVHDLLFEHQDVWAPLKDPAPFLLSLADSVGLPQSQVLPCLTNHQVREVLQIDAEGAAQVGVRSTPSFIIEGGLLQGAAPLATFTGILDSIYTSKTQR
ncbi:MAG: thioredoxin domain-containing protein [Gemmatimonadota bacterium]